MIKACIFDMDGTVLDTISTITYYVNETLKKFGIREISEDECKIFVGNGARVLIERTLKSRGCDENMLEEVLAVYGAAYDANPVYKTAPYDGILKLLSDLQKNNESALRILSVLGSYFSELYRAYVISRENMSYPEMIEAMHLPPQRKFVADKMFKRVKSVNTHVRVY